MRVLVAGELPREAHNAPLHLFSASPELVDFGRGIYQRRSAETSMLLEQLLSRFGEEGVAMYTMEDFKRDYVKKNFPRLTPAERREVLEKLPPGERQEVLQALTPAERRKILEMLPPGERLAGLSPEQILAGLSEEQIRQYLDRLTGGRPTAPRKPRRKKSRGSGSVTSRAGKKRSSTRPAPAADQSS